MPLPAPIAPTVSPVRLVVFDLDGTLLRGDTVCLSLARQLDRLERMQELERLHDLDQISAAREEMASWYVDATAAQRVAAYYSLCFAPGAREAFRLLKAHGIATAIISLTWEFAVAWCARELSADYHAGTQLKADGSIVHLCPSDKAAWLVRLRDDLGLGREQVAAVGDSWGDAELLGVAGRPFFVGARSPTGLIAEHYPDGDIALIARQLINE